MEVLNCLIFRKLTDADFFNINKLPGSETGGGGQSYIDFSTTAIPLTKWGRFFARIDRFEGKYGRPGWKVPIKSLGANPDEIQTITIAQRRDASVSIRSQKLRSLESNRVYAWRPDITGFPQPINPRNREHIYDLHIYIAKLRSGEFWAGWYQSSRPENNWPINEKLNQMFLKDEGFIEFNGDVAL
jgi:5-methylcytosine-specific restriction protein A